MMIETTGETYVPDYTELHSRKKRISTKRRFLIKCRLDGSIQLIILVKEIDGKIVK